MQIAFGGGAMSSVNSCKTYHTDVALLSETHFKPHKRFFIPNYQFIGLTASQEEKAFPLTM
jgi:hypothetical protein